MICEHLVYSLLSKKKLSGFGADVPDVSNEKHSVG